jgi:glutathione S-transferase
MTIVVQKLFMPEEKRDPKTIARAEKGLARPLGVLDTHLGDRKWLVGDSFSIADLNVAGVMLLLQMIDFDLSEWKNVSRWAEACYARESLVRARAKA